MQTYELLTLASFLLSYLFSASRAIITPAQYRDGEIAFYKKGKPGVFEIITFGFTILSLLFLIIHLATEVPRLAQLLLYGMIILFVLILPFHFMPFFRDRMVSSLKQKTAAQYRSSGLKRLAIAVAILALPFIY